MIWDQADNLAAGIGRQALEHPERQAIVAADLVLTYRQIWLIAQSYARRMQFYGVEHQSVVCLKSNDMIVAVAVMIATSLLGVRFAVYEDRLVQDGIIRPSHVFHAAGGTAPADLDSIEIDASWSPRNGQLGDVVLPGYQDPDQGWWYLHTSGTTGRPKYMLLSQRAAVNRSRATAGDFRGAATRFCSIFPCTARPFFVRAMAALFQGSTIIDAIDPRFLMAQQVNLVCASPRQAAEWIVSCPFEFRLPLLQVSGAPMSGDTRDRLLSRFDQVQDVYGASETNKSFVNSYTRAGVVGLPQDSTLQIIGPDGLELPNGQVGEIRVQNHYSVSSYIDAPAASQNSFRDGWFHPGDLGRIGRNGVLEITGRLDEVINLGGAKIDPVRVDQVLQSVEDVRNAACFADPFATVTPRLMAFLVLKPGSDAAMVAARVQARCQSDLPPDLHPSRLFVVADIPMTHDGAPKRRDCQDMVRALSAAPPIPREDPK